MRDSDSLAWVWSLKAKNRLFSQKSLMKIKYEEILPKFKYFL